MSGLPILFSGPMVRSIIARRKRQTRRITGLDTINALPDGWKFDRWQDGYPDGRPRAVFLDFESEPIGIPCPYGTKGGQIWVRETWRRADSSTSDIGGYHYRADLDEQAAKGQWRPSIHMPREASRILLGVEEVRLQRLQENSEEDAQAEGVTLDFADGEGDQIESFKAAFARTWSGMSLWNANTSHL